MEIAGHSGGVHFRYHHVATDDLLVAFERVEKYLGEYREKGEVVPWSEGGSNSGSKEEPEGLLFRPTGTDSATAKLQGCWGLLDFVGLVHHVRHRIEEAFAFDAHFHVYRYGPSRRQAFGVVP